MVRLCLKYIIIEPGLLPDSEFRPLTLLSHHVKQTALSTHYPLTWLPALVTMITNQLKSNAWTTARHLSPLVWWSKCHWALGQPLASISAMLFIIDLHKVCYGISDRNCGRGTQWTWWMDGWMLTTVHGREPSLRIIHWPLFPPPSH